MKTKSTLHPDAAFPDEKRRPTAADLPTVLGRAHAPLHEMLERLRAAHPDVIPEWTYSPRGGWHQIYSRKARRIFYLVPRRGGFVLNLVLGDKAIEALRRGPDARRLQGLLKDAKRYPEGTLILFTPETMDAALVGAVIDAKLAF